MSSSDSEEDVTIRYGTPLEPFEEDEVPSKKKFQQQPDQFAVDAHGQRRFHGAFTGGFSAGYGNSVGTPDGWTPATFKSSRKDKAQQSHQKPEDFMDDEDRSEFGIAPRHVQTHHEFSGQKRSRQKHYHDGPIPGEPVLQQLLKAVHETAAVRMLRKMGWREGQGTGDRVTRTEKKSAKERHKVYGCYIPPEIKETNQEVSDNDSTDSEFDFDTLFAPDDYEPYILARKNDRFGLGYSGLSRHSVLGNLVGEYGSEAGSSSSHLVMKEKGKKVSIRGQAFGVGALEADDEDIYAKEDMSHYDFAIGGAPDVKQKTSGKGSKEANVLEGFVKSTKPLPAVPSYPPPALPRDYVPAPAGARRSRFEASDAPQRDQGLGRHELTANARGALLGESPLPITPQPPTQTPQSPIETPQPPTQTKNDTITKLIGRNVQFTSQQDEKALNFISIKDSGKELTKVFKPFVSDPQKQARYERYLKDGDSYVIEGDGNMDKLREWERNREMIEFEQAAKLYRPLSGIMSDRFTHASEPDEALNPLCAVAKSSNNYGLATEEQIEAAKRGVYGVMTRREVSWRPETLVCKRFNVPEPGAARIESKQEDKPKVSYSIFSYLESSVHDKESFAKEQGKFSGSKSLSSALPKPIHDATENVKVTDKANEKNDLITSNNITTTGFTKRMTVAELFLKESEKDLKTQNQDAVIETINKFDKMDLYKSIFLSDSEDETQVEEKRTEINFEQFIDAPKNLERNLSPPRGIFANINFDEINSWKRNTANKDKDEVIKEDGNTSKANDEKKEDDVEVYGPKVPDNFKSKLNPEAPVFVSRVQRNTEVVELDSSSSSDSWVDMKEVKSKNKKVKKKKSKKHKTKRKKTKHKKKDR